MSRRPGELTPYLSNRHFYGAELRRLRVDAGMTLENVASRTISSKSQIHRIEQAEMLPPVGMSGQLDRLFATNGHFDRLYQLVLNSQEVHPEQYRRRMAMEARATMIEQYVGLILPGLFQTESYARAVFRASLPRASAEEINTHMEARFARQARLRGSEGPDVSVILDEAAVRRPVGGPAVMREQLGVLIEVIADRTATIQLLPFDHGEHGLMGATLTLMTLDDGTSVAYEESITTGTLLEEASEVRALQRHYDLLRSEALSPAKTATFIQSVREALPA